MIALTTPPPAELARQLTGRDYLSWSAVTTYLKCPLRYKFRYLDQLPEPLVAASLVFGSAVHAAVEAHFQASSPEFVVEFRLRQVAKLVV